MPVNDLSLVDSAADYIEVVEESEEEDLVLEVNPEEFRSLNTSPIQFDANTHPKTDPGPMQRIIRFHLNSKASSSLTVPEALSMSVQTNPEQVLGQYVQ